MGSLRRADGELIDWLETFGGSAEYDEITRLWTIHPREPDYPAQAGRTLRAAGARAMRTAAAVDLGIDTGIMGGTPR